MAKPRQGGLGRGLGALIPSEPSVPVDNSPLREIPIADMRTPSARCPAAGFCGSCNKAARPYRCSNTTARPYRTCGARCVCRRR